MSFLIRVDYERTGDKATQRPSAILTPSSWVEAMSEAENAWADDVDRVVIERT